jgi:hypothetical protein
MLKRLYVSRWAPTEGRRCFQTAFSRKASIHRDGRSSRRFRADKSGAALMAATQTGVRRRARTNLRDYNSSPLARTRQENLFRSQDRSYREECGVKLRLCRPIYSPPEARYTKRSVVHFTALAIHSWRQQSCAAIQALTSRMQISKS